jgi:type II secretory pathway pseudopilin PulG
MRTARPAHVFFQVSAMFSLIITLVSIALVAALALATLYYGGSSWLRGNAAAAATLANQGQQVLAAMTLYYTEHSAYPADLQDLVNGEYLKTVPVPPSTAALAPGLVAPALAAGEAWTMLAAG